MGLNAAKLSSGNKWENIFVSKTFKQTRFWKTKQKWNNYKMTNKDLLSVGHEYLNVRKQHLLLKTNYKKYFGEDLKLFWLEDDLIFFISVFS